MTIKPEFTTEFTTEFTNFYKFSLNIYAYSIQ